MFLTAVPPLGSVRRVECFVHLVRYLPLVYAKLSYGALNPWPPLQRVGAVGADARRNPTEPADNLLMQPSLFLVSLHQSVKRGPPGGDRCRRPRLHTRK